jgi:hypothetical protein
MRDYRNATATPVPTGRLPQMQTVRDRNRLLYQATGKANATQKERNVPPPWSDERTPAMGKALLEHPAFERDANSGQFLSKHTRVLVSLLVASGVNVDPDLARAASLEYVPDPNVQASLQPDSTRILAGRGKRPGEASTSLRRP